MLSICIPIYNRSKVDVGLDQPLELFPSCLKSIVKSVDNLEHEVFIYDYNSVDLPLSNWVNGVTPNAKIVYSEDSTFSRGRALNFCAKNAKYNNLLLLDADMIVSSDLIECGVRHLKNNVALFPVCYSYTNPGHTEGFWRHSGYGICFVTKKMVESVGGWLENANWGGEDMNFYMRIDKMYQTARIKVDNYFHQWHPDDFQWKNRYYVQCNYP